MKYSEAKKVLEQQGAAQAIMAKYEKLVSAHKEHGFGSRRELIQALQEIDKAETGKRGGAGKARGPRGLSAETIDQIKMLKSEGKSNAEIARTAGVSPLTVAKYVKGQAGKRAPGKRKASAAGKTGAAGKRGLSPEKVDQIKAMKGEGKSNAEIARTAGVSPLTVAKYVKGQPRAAKPAGAVTQEAPKKRKASAKRRGKKAVAAAKK